MALTLAIFQAPSTDYLVSSSKIIPRISGVLIEQPVGPIEKISKVTITIFPNIFHSVSFIFPAMKIKSPSPVFYDPD
jgi:hypothetical protein